MDVTSGDPTRSPESKVYPTWWPDEKIRVQRAADQVTEIVAQLSKTGPVEVVVSRQGDGSGLARTQRRCDTLRQLALGQPRLILLQAADEAQQFPLIRAP